MSKQSKEVLRQQSAQRKAAKQKELIKVAASQRHTVPSLLDVMAEGNEYTSIVNYLVPVGCNLLDEAARAIAEIEQVRGRPCIAYVGNVVNKAAIDSGIDSSDDLPFQEMVAKVPATAKAIDIILSTNGGSGQQVSRFVNCLRQRFDEVSFLIPSFCMSAGTLFALSGEHIWMTERACLGPIDPQVPSAGGRYVPAQALLLLVAQLQRDGDEAMKKGLTVPWTAVRLIDSLDKKELGDAITASQWSQSMAAQYIERYKFKDWTVRKTSGQPVTSEYRTERANEIASALVSHDLWKSHGHAISREVLWSEIKLKIDHPDPGLERAMARLWALMTWIFDKTPAIKLMCSRNYQYGKQQQQLIIGPMPGS